MLHLKRSIDGNYYNFIDTRVFVAKLFCAIHKKQLPGYRKQEFWSQDTTKDRAIMDIMRSVAHELVHHCQNQNGQLTGDVEEGADGSPIENEANAKAGEIMRVFGKQNPEIYTNNK